MSGTSGPRFPASFVRSAQSGSSLKTSPDMSRSASMMCCENYGAWASRLRLASSQRQKQARRISGSGSLLWPTVTVSDSRGARSFGLDGASIRANAGATLNDMITLWPTPMAGSPEKSVWSTPRASDAEKGGPNQKFGAGGIPLPAQAAQWPTPAARDYKGENSPDHLLHGTGRLHMGQLPNAVAHGFIRPAPAISPDGELPSPHAPISRPLWRWMMRSFGRAISRRLWQGRKRRRLNPLFVEWLMAWPTGHALCACSATEFILWRQHMRGALSRFPMASGPWIWVPPPQHEKTSAQAARQMDLFDGE